MVSSGLCDDYRDKTVKSVETQFQNPLEKESDYYIFLNAESFSISCRMLNESCVIQRQMQV
jgi:hypothetical protein